MIAAAIAIFASGVEARPPAVAPLRFSPAQVGEQVARCGIAVARVSIRDEPEVQETVIAIAAGPPLGEEQLACVARVSLAALTYVEFAQADQQKRYNAVYQPIEEEDNLTAARAWLGARGLLASLPSYDPTRQTLTAYGQSLEAFCSIERGALLTTEHGILTIRGDLIASITGKPSRDALTDEQFECLLNATTASNLREHGAGFGFVGNGATPTD